MTERPILFSGEMVRAILDGRKTQTRRVIKPQPEYGLMPCCWNDTGWGIVAPPNEHGAIGCTCKGCRCPYGHPDDLLWVRETHVFVAEVVGLRPGVAYQADSQIKWVDAKTMPDGATVYNAEKPDFWKWRPSIHMPRWASRITLRVTDVRVERVQEISEDNAQAEGVDLPVLQLSHCLTARYTRVAGFRHLWDSINAARGFGWDANPWVWVVEFERVTP